MLLRMTNSPLLSYRHPSKEWEKEREKKSQKLLFLSLSGLLLEKSKFLVEDVSSWLNRFLEVKQMNSDIFPSSFVGGEEEANLSVRHAVMMEYPAGRTWQSVGLSVIFTLSPKSERRRNDGLQIGKEGEGEKWNSKRDSRYITSLWEKRKRKKKKRFVFSPQTLFSLYFWMIYGRDEYAGLLKGRGQQP